MAPADDLCAEGYADLVTALRARRMALGLSQAEIDYRAAWAEGLCGKLECNHRAPNYRRAGDVTLRRWLRVLGLRIRLEVVAAVEPMTPAARHQATNKKAA